MKKVFLKPPRSSSYLNNGVFRINNGHNIFWKFKNMLLQKQILINTIDLDTKDDGDSYIYADVPYPWETSLWKKVATHTGKNILFCFESPIINPFSHMKPLHNFFSKIYTWDDHVVDNKRYLKMYIPQLNDQINNKAKQFKNKDFLVLINAKKSLPPVLRFFSLSKLNLFNERLKAIIFFDTYLSDEFYLYGKGWNKPDPFKLTERIFGFKHFRTYKGEIKDDGKIEILSKFKFSICFENTAADGYITEKIFDCFKARCVPIYWGAPNITDYIPKECFIDFREFIDYEKLLKYLKNISESTYNKYIESIEEFLSDREMQNKWFEEGFRKLFLKSIT